MTLRPTRVPDDAILIEVTHHLRALPVGVIILIGGLVILGATMSRVRKRLR